MDYSSSSSDSDWIEEVEETVVATYILNQTVKNRRFWVHPINEERNEKGVFTNLFPQLINDPEKFHQFFRMSYDQFSYLHNLIKDDIKKQNTQFRAPVPSEQRLAVCLRFLATGESYRSLAFSFRLGFSTTREIVEEVCEVIWKTLRPIYMPKPTKDDWQNISREYKEIWNFPNCIGSLDGKHINIQCPINGGSAYFNYKGVNSIVLLALVDAHYRFITIDVGSYGRNSDGNVFAKSALGKALENDTLDVPPDTPIEENGDPMPYVIVADEAFPLKPYLMRPYSRVTLGGNEGNKIFNYRLSRARRVVENAFGILSNRWRVFRTNIQVQPKSVDNIVLAACCLHNMLCQSHDFQLDETNNYESTEVLENMEPLRGNSTQRSFEIREKYKDFFLSSVGAVPWQYEMIRRGRINI
ncbi:protein ALP1-like [Acyrthosiphon pisum]|uniref:DDE Tnp4 domain-containing protein n=1 Tax=Acyrthosiphon pisum TaxID=7029 RepID=A0A8R1W3A9_ACYPI|nr:protein ALP1-like [Acyrthosiphon pisum]|eukprot:XP_001946487.2 PREDICTED: putative nuclease HARBI1 [Acyrthosiphon pisum]